MTDRHKVYLCVYLILQTDGKFLLSLRKNTGYQDGKWGLVGGHAESNETIREAICREVKEEIGILIQPDDLEVLHFIHRREDRENVDVFMKCKKWEGEISNQEPEKCESLTFFDLDQLPKTIIPYIQRALALIDKGEFYSEEGYDSKK